MALDHGPGRAEWDAAHEALKRDEPLWQSLAFDGVQHDGLGGLVENRRCPSCGSTLSRFISAARAIELCERQAALHALSAEAITDAESVRSRRTSPQI